MSGLPVVCGGGFGFGPIMSGGCYTYNPAEDTWYIYVLKYLNKRKSLYGLASKAMVLFMMRMVPLGIV